MQRSRDFLVSIARRYYIDERSQQEIANEFSLSRPTVSNILKKCKEVGIVEIRIQDGSPRSTALGKQLEKYYGLKKVIIIPSSEDGVSLLSRIGKEAVSYTHTILRDGLQIGIAWGTTLYQMVHQMPEERVPNASIVQLMGGFGAANPQYDGSELARELSKRFHASYYPLQCPVLVQNKIVKQMLLNEPGIGEALEKTKSLDVAFVGLSSNVPDESSLVRAGFLSYEEACEVQAAGAVGHLCGYSYDKDGNWMDISLNQRIIGIDFHDFMKIPERVGIACGLNKTEAVRASLKGGHLTTLITDESIATHLIDK